MTWREFQLKRIGFQRQQKERLKDIRVLAYYSYLSIPEKGKKVSMNKFMPIDDDESITDYQKNALREAQKLAIQELKQKKLQNG